jgi:hypothetical protein
MLDYPIDRLQRHIKYNCLQNDLDDLFHTSHYDELLQAYPYNYPTERFKFAYDEEQEAYIVTRTNRQGEITQDVHNKESFIAERAAMLKSDLVKLINAYLRESDHLTWKTKALNIQFELTKIEKRIKKEGIPWLTYYLKCISNLKSFLSTEYINDTSKAGSPNPSYQVHVRSKKAIKCFYDQLTHFKFIECSIVQFNQFFAASYLDQKIVWLSKATHFNAFIKKLCDLGYLEFNSNKWKTLNEIFIIQDTSVEWDKIYSLKPPSEKILQRINVCFHELDGFNTNSTSKK